MNPTTEKSAKKKERLTILVADQEGDVEKIKLDSTDTLAELLRKGLDALYPNQHKDAADYDIVLAGAVVTDLSQTVADAGLHDRSEIVITPKDVSRG